jgi:hypothetical protein
MSTETLAPERGDIRYVALVCGVATLGGLLFGYDTAVIAGAIGFLRTAIRPVAGSWKAGRPPARWPAARWAPCWPES